LYCTPYIIIFEENNFKHYYMSGINKVILVGHLGKDPEIRFLESGVKKASFSIATSETYKNKDGQTVDQTEWHNIVAWRGLADIIEKYVKKGQLVYIEGKIRSRTYEKDGIKKYYTEIVADNMQMLGGKREAGSTENVDVPPANTVNDPPNPTEDDLPF
jgi:single-strand DNA-binding protein